MNRHQPTFCPPRHAVSVCLGLAAFGGMSFLAGLLLAPQSAWAGLLLVSFFLLGLGLAGAVIVALLYVTGAGWATALRRVPEAMVAILPMGMLGLVLVFACQPSLYPWSGGDSVKAEPGRIGNPSYVASPFKAAWLSWPFFLGRSAVYFALWFLLANALVRNSRRQDADGDPALTTKNTRLSAVFLVVFALTFWLASYDWIMSLEPEWYSTIFGLYNFAGMFVAGLAAVVLLTIWLHSIGPFRGIVGEAHYHDLGKLVFAFSTFWAYIWFCQYMLIWYVNNPEETPYFIRRLEGAWQPLFLANVVVNWLVPFIVLLPRSTKCNPGVLAKVALLILLGRGLDLYLMILPTVPDRSPVVWILVLGILFGGGGLFCLVIFSSLGQALLVPRKDSYLIESLPHHDMMGQEHS